MKFRSCFRKTCKQVHLPGTQRTKRATNYNNFNNGCSDWNQNYWYPAPYEGQWNQPFQNFNYQSSSNNQGNNNFQRNRRSINNAKEGSTQELVKGFQELQKSLQTLIERQMPNPNPNVNNSQNQN